MIYYDFSHFTLIILLSGPDNFQQFSMYPAQICNMHAIHNKISKKFNNGWKQFKVVDLLWFLPCGRDEWRGLVGVLHGKQLGPTSSLFY